MQKKHLLLGLLLMALLPFERLSAQTLHGVIQAKTSGTTISGVSVRNKSEGKIIQSNSKGEFTITAQLGDTLIFSHIDYKTLTYPVSEMSGKLILIALDDNIHSLEDVLVTTALGIKRNRNSLPYATQQITGNEVNTTPTTNFVDNLSGKIAGLQVVSSNSLGGATNVILRGYKSLTQSNQALFVIDGVPYDNTTLNQSGYDLGNAASDINPDDIASVTVLKGAAASALYGSRAANGVIIINTKKGGSENGKLGITVNESVSIGSVDKSTLPVYQTEYGQGYGSSGYNPAYPNQNGFFYYTPVFNSGGQPVSVVQTDWDIVRGAAYDPSLLVYNWDAFSPGNPNYGKATPWTAAKHYSPTYFFVTPVSNITSAYINGGNDKASFKLGYTYNYDGGLLPNSNIQKHQLNFGSDYKISEQLTFGGLINYVDENGLNRGSYDFRAPNSVMRDFRQWWPTNVDLQEQKDDYFRSLTNNTWNWLGGYTTAAPGNLPSAAYHNNPYWTMYQNYNNDSRERYFGNVHLNYKITPYLNLTGRISRDSYNEIFETRIAAGSYETSSYSKYNSYYGETNFDVLLNFDKNLGSSFNLKALLGGNVRKNLTTSDYSATNGGLVQPELYALSNSVNTPAAPVETYIKKEVDGIFAGATLTYKELVTVDATVRRDRSSALAASNNTYYYPAISANLLFSKWLQNLRWLSYGKLRVNYAEVGSDAPPYSLQNTYAAGTPINGQTMFAYTTTNNNANLVPERNKSYEGGLELSFLHNRLGLDVTYYHSRLINQIMPIIPSTATGFSYFYVNGGTVQNQGVEVSINAEPVKTKNFAWNIILNWSKNNNKVISLYGGQPSYTIASLQNSIQLVAEVGKPYGVLRGSDYQYLNGQILVDAAGYPIKSTNSESDIGNINPKWIGGISNSFTYKNFTLSFLIDVKQGGDVYSLDMDYGAWAGVYAQTAGKNDLGNPVRSPLSQGGGVLIKGVTADGKPNTVRVDAYDINADGSQFPFSSVNSLAAKSYVYDASYAKLRELSISYSIPDYILKRIKYIKGIDIALTGRNLWIIHKNLPYSDPEQGEASNTANGGTPVYNQNAAIGYQSGAYPSVRQIAFNLKLKF